MPDLTLTQALMLAVAALAGAVGVMFLWFKDAFARCEAKEEKCQSDYRNLLERVVKFETATNLRGGMDSFSRREGEAKT